LQLAFCYKIGFGIPRSEEKSKVLLAQSHKHDVLEDQLIALKQSAGPSYNPSTIYGLWHDRGVISTTTDAQYYREQNLLASVQTVHEREIMDWAAVLEPSHWIVLATAGYYQAILENLGLLDKAEDVARDILRKVSETVPENVLVVTTSKQALAKALLVNEKLEEAEKLAQEVDKVEGATFGRPKSALLPCIYAAQGKTKDAAVLMEALMDNFSSTFGADHARTLVIRWNLCEIYRQQRRIKEAIALSEPLLQAAITTLGEEHEFSLLVRMSLTRLLWERRTWLGGFNGPRGDGTLKLDFIKTSQALLGNNHPWTIDLLVSTVRNLVGKARFPEAIALQKQIITLSETRPGLNHPRTVQHRNRLRYLQKVYSSYLFFERIGSLHIGQYVLTPSLREREGLERICWPLHKKKDMTKVTPFELELSTGSHHG
jgi:tetratricopeptide (TPR) repeat protein